MKLYFKNQGFSYELLRAVAYSGYQGAEIGECLATAAKIKEGNLESWFVEWEKTADRIRIVGETCLGQGNIVSGREALLRSSNYYRTAEFFLLPNDSRRNDCYSKSVVTFQEAMKHMDFYCESVRIPYEDAALCGYFYRACNYESNPSPKATLVFVGGFDSTCEELYFAGAAPAIKRGYNCLIFDGPGQGETLRVQKKAARFDFEVPVSAALDYLEQREEVDMNKISLMGMSMGGYYAPRAAAFDARIKACIAYDVLYDMWESMMNTTPKLKWVEKFSPSFTEHAFRLAMKMSSALKWQIEHALWVFGLEHGHEISKTVSQYTLKNVGHKIECPMLILVGECDHFISPEQASELEKKLKCPTTVRTFTKEEGAEEHCQEGNHMLLHQVIFDWMDSIFAKV